MSRVAAAASEAGSVAPARPEQYRAHLDGLRAVAVYLVVLFHAGWRGFEGGFVGVDVFFVLSGYLVTEVLLRDLDGRGAVRIGRFYSRRFRRLLPAAFVTLVVSAAVFTAIASPLEVSEARDGLRAAFLYVTNWYFIDQASDYFGADLETNPVLHFWSLAVEEQFYLLWPLLLAGITALARPAGPRRATVVRSIVLAGAVASLVWAWALKGSDPARAYYGTDARAYQLLAGASLALLPAATLRRLLPRAWARPLAPVSLVALVLVSTRLLDVDPIVRGTIVMALTLVTIASLERAPAGPGAWALSRPGIVYLGKVSYGTYLWHWPVIFVLARTFEVSTLSTILLTILLATALASLSFQLMEHPIRTSRLLDRHRLPVIASGLAVSVVSALVLIPAVTDTSRSDGPSQAAVEITGFTPVPADFDFAAARRDVGVFSNCLGESPSACTVVEGTGAHVLLIGDSHGAMVLPSVLEVARVEGLTVSMATAGGCPWQRDLYVPGFDVSGSPLRPEDCRRFKDDLYERVLPALDPDVVIAMNLAYETPRQSVQYLQPDGGPLLANDLGFEPAMVEHVRESTAQLSAAGADVVVLEPIPWNPRAADPVACLSDAEFVEACRFVYDAAVPSPLEAIYRSLADADERMWSLDLDPLVCPFRPICDPIVDGVVVRADSSHISKRFAKAIGPALGDLLASNGVLATAG